LNLSIEIPFDTLTSIKFFEQDSEYQKKLLKKKFLLPCFFPNNDRSVFQQNILFPSRQSAKSFSDHPSDVSSITLTQQAFQLAKFFYFSQMNTDKVSGGL
jgi:hypothetical protein